MSKISFSPILIHGPDLFPSFRCHSETPEWRSEGQPEMGRVIL